MGGSAEMHTIYSLSARQLTVKSIIREPHKLLKDQWAIEIIFIIH